MLHQKRCVCAWRWEGHGACIRPPSTACAGQATSSRECARQATGSYRCTDAARDSYPWSMALWNEDIINEDELAEVMEADHVLMACDFDAQSYEDCMTAAFLCGATWRQADVAAYAMTHDPCDAPEYE